MKIGDDQLTNASLHNIILETCVQGEKSRKEQPSHMKKLCRYQFMEIMIRFAVYLYSNKVLRAGNFVAELDPYTEISPSQAFFMFIENKVKPFYHMKDI